MNKSVAFKDLQELIKKEKNLKIKQELTLKQINILKEVQEEFLIKAKNSGYSLDSYNVLTIMQEQFKAMRTLAEQVNIPTIEYDNKIKEINLKIFGNFKLSTE